MMQQRSDEELLDRARAGDRQALGELMGRYQARVYRFGMKMCRDPEDAKDVLQETLLAMVKNVRDFRGASSISTWLYTIARSFCIKKRRRSKFASAEEHSLDAEVVPGASGLQDQAKRPDEALADKQVEQAVEQAIAALDPMYREVLLLRDVEGLTAPEVAEVLGISTPAVKSRLHRARLSVREQVAPLLGLPTEAPAAPGTCPDVLSLLSRHLEDEISPDVCAQMARHVEACPRCRSRCDSLQRTLALCRSLGSSVQVPASVQEAVRDAIRTSLAERA
ncbi:MAG: sigma-70 family RNA polymerase sigma factor [Myxococcales bacterium]|nr:sigma-70 family RNA polymerase sigma factor [Myxococcales bacterium]